MTRETDRFSPGRTIHCVTTLKEASQTAMKFAWWIGCRRQPEPKRLEIDYKTHALERGVRPSDFAQDWPQGKYKVQIYVNGDLD